MDERRSNAEANRTLYAGSAEEAMLRWGAMSLAACSAVSLLGRQRHMLAIVLGIIVAAGLFAAVHLPAVVSMADRTPAIMIRTLVLNGITGLLYGGCVIVGISRPQLPPVPRRISASPSGA